MVSFGLCLGPSWGSSVAELLPLARAAESQGFDRIATGDFHNDPLIWASLLAGATDHIPVATTILSIAGRHPAVVGEAVAALRDVHGERIELGLGVSHPSLVEEELGLTPPGLAELEQYAAAVRATMHGTAGRFGPYQVPAAGRNRARGGEPPLLVAALGRTAVARAAGYADGIILTWSPLAWTSVLVTELGERSPGTGRRPAVWNVLPTFLDDDHDHALQACGAALLPYLQLPSYGRMLAEAFGDPELVADAAAATRGEEVVTRLGAARLSTLAAIGSPGDVHTAVADQHAAGVDEVVLYPLDVGRGWEAAAWACVRHAAPAR